MQDHSYLSTDKNKKNRSRTAHMVLKPCRKKIFSYLIFQHSFPVEYSSFKIAVSLSIMKIVTGNCSCSIR